MKDQLKVKAICLPSQQDVIAWSARIAKLLNRSERPLLIETPKEQVQETSVEAMKFSFSRSIPGMSGEKTVVMLYSHILPINQIPAAYLPYSIN